MEDGVVVEKGVKPHVVDIDPNDRVNLSVPGVSGKWTHTKLDHSDACDEQQDDVEHEAVHPGFVLLHWVETAAAWETDSKFDIALLNTPKDIQCHVSEYESSNESCISVLHEYQKLVEKWDQRSAIEPFQYISNESKQ